MLSVAARQSGVFPPGGWGMRECDGERGSRWALRWLTLPLKPHKIWSGYSGSCGLPQKQPRYHEEQVHDPDCHFILTTFSWYTTLPPNPPADVAFFSRAFVLLCHFPLNCLKWVTWACLTWISTEPNCSVCVRQQPQSPSVIWQQGTMSQSCRQACAPNLKSIKMLFF